MKNNVLILILLSFLIACSSAPINNITEKTITKNSVNVDEAYLALKARAQVDDVTLNYSDLRKAFTKSSYYQPYGSDERKQVEDIFKLYGNDQFQLCLDSAEEFLSKNFISLGGHYVSVVCAKALKLDEKAYLHEEILEGLLHSISNSGDGQSVETAYTVYTTEELYTFLQLNGLQVKGQGIINEKNKVFETMHVGNQQTLEEYTLFFDITTQWQHAFSDLKK